MPKLSGWKSVKDKELYETLKPSGISLFILKPFNKEQIVAAVKNYYKGL